MPLSGIVESGYLPSRDSNLRASGFRPYAYDGAKYGAGQVPS